MRLARSDRDRLRDGDFAHELFFRLVRGMTLEALSAAAERRDRTFAHFVGAQCGDQRQAAALLFGAAARGAAGRAGVPDDAPAPGRRDVRGASSSSASSVSLRPGTGFLTGLRSSPEALLGDFAGLALGFFVVFATVVLFALPRFGGFAFGLIDCLHGLRGGALLPRRSCVLPPRAARSRRAHARARRAPPRSACAAPRRTASALGGRRRRGARFAAAAARLASAASTGARLGLRLGPPTDCGA